MTFMWFILTVLSALGLLVTSYVAGRHDLLDEQEGKEDPGPTATAARAVALFCICAIVLLTAWLGRGC